MHLRLCKSIDFCEGKIYGFMPSSITDDHMHSLFMKCPHLESVYGLHPVRVERRRLRKRSTLTVPGIIEALSLCGNLKSIETSDLRLLEAVLQHLPQLRIIGHFQNRDGVFPPHASQRLKLLPYPRVSALHLTGVEVPELTAMPHLEHLHLYCVRFTKLQPFRAFLATRLKTFVMKHCMGPSLSLRYLSLIIALSSAPSLTRLELVRVPLPGGLFQRAVEDSYRHNGFINLKILVISGCKGMLEADVGHLMIVSSKNLERVFIQPSLTRDSLFVSLSYAECQFPKLKNIHLGYVDKLEFGAEWSNEALLSMGLAEVPDTPSSLTDSGMKVISQLFPNIKSMTVSNCPHLMAMDQWSSRIVGEPQAWKELTDLTLQRCHCLQLPSFALFLAFLPKIEVVLLNDMFREPPKGCSHVGLSAGTGLGMSSAVVSNQDEHIAVPGHPPDFELPADGHGENEDFGREFIDMDNEGHPEHVMVLQQEFFEEERRAAPPFKEADGGANDEIKFPIITHIYSRNEIPPVSFSSGNRKILDTNKLDEEKFLGPLTRRRKRVLNQDEKTEILDHRASNSIGGKNYKVSNSDEETSLQNKFDNNISISESNSSCESQLKKDIVECENKCLTDQNSQTKSDVKDAKNNEASPPPEEKKDSEKAKKVKKHKKHKHKRCKKSRRCNKSCHKRGPLTRSKSNKHLIDGHNFVSQGTQATSADIRRALRRQRTCSLRCKKRGNGVCGSSHRRSHRHISARQQFKRPNQNKSNVELQNKATSTSDPLMEDDAVQTLRLVSETLISLTIVSCGISDIVVDHCQSLTHVEVQACRILKVFQLHYCPSLKRLNISQCPKLTLDVIVPEVLSLIATKKLLVSFEPCMQIYHPSDSEKAIFSRAPLDLGIILFHDFTGHIDETLQAGVKENLLRWMEVVQKLYYSPSFWVTKQKKKRVKAKEYRTRYPYGHCLRRFHGMCTLLPSVGDEILNWKYQVLTNDYVFASVLENKSWEKGFPAPESIKDYTEDDALLSMIETEYTEKKLRMRKKIVSFYIPVIDST
ncbi:f-box only protein 38 [Nephila pilipes]|uniref:F-box only protein 38 n=1 Tax=Nephila pilipes TaxID=299642 RepID=A0A8X6TTG1_NEPPI|nr:f-box only protein 38 [Nephila pilipes]